MALPRNMLHFNRNPNQLVLCVTAKQLLAGVWAAGVYQGSQLFVSDAQGYHAFLQFLSQYQHAPVYILADTVEEDYRLEQIPHTSGRAKNELIQRKLNQFYRNVQYRTAYFVGREADKRRDDRYLFVALNNAEFMQPWINVLQSVEMPLVGVYLLPMLSQVIVRQHKLMAPHILLCEKLSSGLRQTYLHNGRLRMSRLVAEIPQTEDDLNYFYLAEIEKTRLYLISQRLILRETPLHLVLAGFDDYASTMAEAISQEQGLTANHLNLAPFAHALGLPNPLVQKTPALMHMQLLVNGHAVNNLAPKPLTQQHQVHLLKRAIYGLSVCVLVLSIVVAGWFLALGIMDQEAIKQAEKDTYIQTQRYLDVAQDFPAAPVRAGDLQVAVGLDQVIATYPSTPVRMLHVVSRALARSPEIQLDRLRWVMATEPNVQDQDDLISIAERNVSPQNTALVLHADPTAPNEMAFLTAEIAQFNGNYRAALDSVNRFVRALKQDTTVAWVAVLQEPVNVSSFASLQGSTADVMSGTGNPRAQEPALFKLKILLKPPAEEVAEVNFTPDLSMQTMNP